MNHLRMMGSGFLTLMFFLGVMFVVTGLIISAFALMNHIVGSTDWIPWFLGVLLVAGISYMIGYEEKAEKEQEKLG